MDTMEDMVEEDMMEEDTEEGETSEVAEVDLEI